MGGSRNLSQNIDQLVEVSKISARSRLQPIVPLISSICDNAYEHGLSNESLARVLNLLRSQSNLDQKSIATLIQGLYPANKVPPTLICGIVASLGQGEQKPSSAIQGLLILWIIMVYDVLEDVASLQRLYSVLFNLLDALSIRSYLCHLLALLTQRNHVKPYRIRRLLEMNRGVGNDPGVTGLLLVYKRFYPEIIIGSGKRDRFEYPNTEWRDRLSIIQESATTSPRQNGHDPLFPVVRDGVKRRRLDLVPEIHTRKTSQRSIALEEITSLDDFVNSIEKIEPPTQAAAALDDPLLRMFMHLKLDTDLSKRLYNWTSLFLDSQLKAAVDNAASSQTLRDIFFKLLNHLKYTRQLSIAWGNILARYLEKWDGRTNRDLLFELLTFVDKIQFEIVRPRFLLKIEKALLDDTEASTITLLNFYTSMLRRWASQYIARPFEYTNLYQPLESLVAYASRLILRLLTVNPSITAQTAILHHLSSLASIISYAPSYDHIHILTPSPKTVYLLAFLSPTVSTLSSLSGTLATYKVAFEACISKQRATGSGTEYPRPYVNEFNGFLMDICNLLWRSRAFNTTDTNALGCLFSPHIYPTVRRYTENTSPPHLLQGLFSLSFHPALVALSIAAFREIEEKEMGGSGSVTERHAGPVTQRSLALLGQNGGVKVGWSDYRLEVLQWLADMGSDGVKELMFKTMKLLMSVGKGEGDTPRGSQVEK